MPAPDLSGRAGIRVDEPAARRARRARRAGRRDPDAGLLPGGARLRPARAAVPDRAALGRGATTGSFIRRRADDRARSEPSATGFSPRSARGKTSGSAADEIARRRVDETRAGAGHLVDGEAPLGQARGQEAEDAVDDRRSRSGWSAPTSRSGSRRTGARRPAASTVAS